MRITRRAALLCLALTRWAYGQQPKVTTTKFDEMPARMFYLEDTTTMMYQDIRDGNVWISDDEGRNWQRAPGVEAGVAMLTIEHPFDNTRAYILTKGTTHYQTSNRGKTWQQFTVPAPPAWVPNPLSFHSDKAKWGHILFLATKCEKSIGWLSDCHDVTYYTTDGFANTKLMLEETSRCQFAHSTKEFKHDAHKDLVYCVAFASLHGGDGHGLEDSHLFESTDFFQKERLIVDFDVGEKNARGVLAFGISSKFAVAALKSPASGEMTLFVTTDTKQWAQAQFPHASESKLRENGYTIVESTTHSLGIDVLLHSNANVGTFYVSNSNGTYFVESLKDTNRNEAGFVDFENIVGVEGIGIANIVTNARDVEGRRAQKQIASRITFDDGSSWSSLKAPAQDIDGKAIGCNVDDAAKCSLHLHSVTNPHNFGRVFSSTAPGFVMGVGSVGEILRPYEECDTFLSTDAGVTWSMVHKGAHSYEFGNKGAVLVIVNDEEATDTVQYSFDSGKTWNNLKLDVKIRAKVLTTAPDSTSQQFLIVGYLGKDHGDKPFATVHLDFEPARKRECTDADMETWHARTIKGKECLMGHKQSYKRKKPTADCFMGKKFEDPVEQEENCDCSDEDYECDYNYVRNGDKCEPMGPEPIPEGTCASPNHDTYLGSSGWRLVPGDTCKSGAHPKDTKIQKPCSAAQRPEGEISHQSYSFPGRIVQHSFFKNSKSILVRLEDNSAYYSLNEGFSWAKKDGQYAAFYMHPFSNERAYMIKEAAELMYTTNAGREWNTRPTPAPPNRNMIPVLAFHPTRTDWLIWIGAWDCPGPSCHARAWYTTDHGRGWHLIDDYVRSCSWARDKDLLIDEQLILCESFRDKKGAQIDFGFTNPLQFVVGGKYYRERKKVFDSIVGYAKFSEYLLVAELPQNTNGLALQVSLDGKTYATGLFPPNMRVEQHAYTILESTTDSVFLLLTMSNLKNAEWGHILKSNSNGTYYSVSLEHVNRNQYVFVDFERMIGLDGIAMANIVANPDQTGGKKLQTRITHNDGGTWKPLVPPERDAHGQPYKCKDVKCTLQLHGFTERYDVRATYSTPSVVGLMMAVGNVGEYLAEYSESDTFLSRDGGFTWEEVRKDAHTWEFGDSGSVLVMANDERPTDHVVYSLNEGKSWKEYKFIQGDTMRVKSIVTVSSDTSRKFVLLGHFSLKPNSDVAVHLDFSQLTKKQCEFKPDDPGHDDFELWSPSEERADRCLFGRRVLYHRRLRDRTCYVGDILKTPKVEIQNCTCTEVDFECEFNHIKENGKCVLSPGAKPLPNDQTCGPDQEFWYERTAYRKNPHSSCDGGNRPDRGTAHRCPGPGNHSTVFWVFFSLIIIAAVVLAAWYFHEQSLRGPGAIRLPDGNSPTTSNLSGPLATLASVPWFLLGVAGAVWGWMSQIQVPVGVQNTFGSRTQRGYRHVPVDEDAQVLRFEDEE